MISANIKVSQVTQVSQGSQVEYLVNGYRHFDRIIAY